MDNTAIVCALRCLLRTFHDIIVFSLRKRRWLWEGENAVSLAQNTINKRVLARVLFHTKHITPYWINTQPVAYCLYHTVQSLFVLGVDGPTMKG